MKFRSIILWAAAAITAVGSSAAAPDYIFYFIGDGMGLGPVQATQNYIKLHSDSATLNMLSTPVRTFAQTWSASSPVTDSAAAGTALATGVKTKNGMLGMNPDSVAVTSIAETLHANGYGVALLTTVAPDDATPGAFYAHVPSRKMFEKIGRQFIDSDFEYLAGSTLRGDTDKAGKPTGLKEAMTDAGISIVYDPDSVAASGSRRVVLLNRNNLNASNVGYTSDYSDENRFNTLDAMMAAGLAHMERVSPDRFFMMVEGGNIDHALHANDGATAVRELAAFDSTIARALEFAAEHPGRTLIIVTADHDTGGLTVGNQRVGYNNYPEFVDRQKASKDVINRRFAALMARDKKPSWDEVKGFLRDNLGFFDSVEINGHEERVLRSTFENVRKNKGKDQKNLYSSINSFVATAVDMFNSKAGYGFTSLSHTGNPVIVAAQGEGQENFIPVNNNILIPEAIMESASLEMPNRNENK